MNNHISDTSKLVPRRIQRRRTKGWRMPPGAIYVGRPTRWANPWDWRAYLAGAGDPAEGRALAVQRFRASLDDLAFLGWPALNFELSDIPALRGRDLVCWCPLDHHCHADVLLALANAPLRCEGV